MKIMKTSVLYIVLVLFSMLITLQNGIVKAENPILNVQEILKDLDKLDGSTVTVRGYLACIMSFKETKYLLTDGIDVIELEGGEDLHLWLRREVEVNGIIDARNRKIRVLSINVREGDIGYSPSIAETLHHSPIGRQRTYVILVNFTDMSQSKDISEIMQVFSEAAVDYYKAVSYDLTWFDDSNVVGWFEMPRTMSYYAADNSTTQQALARDAIEAADPFIDFDVYYRIVIVHAGRNEAVTNNESDIWSYAFLGEILMTTDEGNKWLSIAVVSEFDPLGVYAHEMGHMLGLPDLYDPSGAKKFMGKWDLMAKGNWNGAPAGSSPAHPSSACKISLGWLGSDDIVDVDYGSTITVELKPLESSSGIRAIRIPISSEVYYLVEVRRKTGYDLYLPGEGVLIIFVNETLGPGEGPVRLIDAKPSTTTLNDAYFKVGDSWTNSKYKLSIRVESEVGSAFKVTVTYGDKIVIDNVTISDMRVDVNSTQKILFHAKWNSTGINTSGVKLELNGTWNAYTNASGWATFEVTSKKVGKISYNITKAYIDNIPVTIIRKIENPEIIWDKVIIELIVPANSLRVNVGANATILSIGRYAYDNAVFYGKVYLNASTTWPYLGERWYTVGKIEDYKYGLTEFEANAVKVIYDSLKVEVLTKRILYNPGETFQILVNLTYASDDTPILGGKVQLDGREAYTASDGSAIFTVTAPDKIGTFTLTIKGLTDGKSVTLPRNVETIKLIVTQIIIDEITPVNIRVEVGKPVKVGVHAIWAHNSSSAKETRVTISGEEIEIEEDGWGYIDIVKNSLMKVDLEVEEVNAPSNIVSFNQTAKSYIIWDRIEISIESYTLTPGTITAVVKAKYTFDEEPVRNAIVRINDLRASESEPGVYTVTFEGWKVVYTIEAKLEKEGFNLIIEHANVYAMGNIAFYIIIIAAIAAVVFYFIKVRRGERIMPRIRIPRIE